MIPTQEHQSKPTWQAVTSLGYLCYILQLLLSPSTLTPMPGTGQPSFRHWKMNCFLPEMLKYVFDSIHCFKGSAGLSNWRVGKLTAG